MIYQERRVKTISLPHHVVLEWFLSASEGWKTNRYLSLPMIPELPDGTHVLAVNTDFYSQSFTFLISHESFDPVPEGMSAPPWGSPLTWNTVLIKPVEE